MNSRIQELLLKAGWDRYEALDERNQKFAELIVRECAEIADEGYGSDHFGNGIAGYQLLEHFGVKE
jgi:hypothetical protein